jgi:hypothetical protein
MKTTVAKRLLIALILVFLATVIVPVHAQPSAGVCSALKTDAQGWDETDEQGNIIFMQATASTCPLYMQVVSVDMAMRSGSYVATIKLAGTVPSSLNDSRFFEWNILIDADRSIITDPWGHVYKPFENDMGTDYRVWTQLLGHQVFTDMQNLDTALDDPAAVHLTVGSQMIQLTFTPSSIGGAADFDFVVVTREYPGQGEGLKLMAVDKAPNVGHYSFVGGVLTQTTTTAPLNVTISATSMSGSAPLTVSFSSIVSSGSASFSCNYFWHFGDGQGYVGPSIIDISHTYTQAGTYRAVLVVNVFGTTLNATSNTLTIKVSNETSQVTASVETSSTSTPESTPMLILGLSIIALPFIAIIGLIVFLVRRRRRKSKMAEGLASKPSAPAPTTEETKFCTACGVRIPVTTRFCASCGGKQD